MMAESTTTNINMPTVPLSEFYQMKGQLDGQDREIKAVRAELGDMKKDIKELLAVVNRGKGGLWVAITLGSVLGGVVGVIGELLFRGHN